MSKDKFRIVEPDERLPEGDRELIILRENKKGETSEDSYPVNSEVSETDDGKLVITYTETVEGQRTRVVTTYNYGEWTKKVERTKIN